MAMADQEKTKRQQAQSDALRAIFKQKLGAELRQLREASGLTLQTVSDLFGWGRDAMSKVERGLINISLYDYLQLMHFYRDLDLDHPGVKLAARMLPRVRSISE